MKTKTTLQKPLLNWKKASVIALLFLLSYNTNAATITSTSTGGNWSSSSTWVGGVVPTSTDDVVIASGATVKILTNETFSIKNITVNGTLNTTNNSQLTAYGNFTVSSTGSFSMGSGSDVGTLLIYGNFKNDGTSDFYKSTVVIAGNFTTTTSSLQNNGTLIIGGNYSGVIGGSGNGTIYPVNPSATDGLSGTSNEKSAGTLPTNPSTLYTLMTQVIFSGNCSFTVGDIANQTVCPGFSATFTVTTTATSPTYKWQVNTSGSWIDLTDTTPYSGVTTSTLNINNVTGLNTYKYRTLVTSSGCSVTRGVENNPGTLTVNSLPSVPTAVTPSSGMSICKGSNINLNATSGGNTINWYTVPTGGTSIGSSSSGINFSVTPSNSVTYYAESKSANGCLSTSRTATASITVNSPSTAPTAITGTTTICNGSSTTLTATGGSLGTGANYQWGTGTSIGTNPISGQTTATLTVSPSSTITYWVRVENTTSPCTGTTSGLKQMITVNPLPDNTSTGFSSSTFCQGSQATLTFDINNLSGTPPYTLSYRNDATNVIALASISSDSPTAFNASPNPTTSTHYTLISITDANGCINSSPNDSTAQVTFTAMSVGGTISGGTSVCSGNNSSILTLTANTGTITGWESSLDNFVSAGTSITNTTSSLTVSNLNTTTYYRAIVTNGVCPSTNSSIATLTVNQTPSTPSIDSIIQPTCANSTGSFQISNYDNSYIYSISSSSSISGVNISGNIITAPIGTYMLKSTKNSCSSPDSTPVTINEVSKTWIGSVSSNWFDDGNWYPTGVPSASNCVSIPNVSNISNAINKVIISGANAYANALTVQNGATLEIDTTGTLTLTDVLNVNSGGNMTLKNNASLIQINDVTNSGNITVIRDSTPVILNDYTYWSSPVTGSQKLFDFSPNSNPKYFLAYENKWIYLNAYNETFAEGIGYAILGPKDANSTAKTYTYQFTGTPNNGNSNIPVSLGTGSFSSKLLGNPYPSALDANKFIDANIIGTGTSNKTLSGTLYFWTHNHPAANGSYSVSDYAAYNKTGGTAVPSGTGNSSTPSKWIASGQGFVAEVKADGQVSFSNNMRIGAIATNNTNFYRNSNIVDAEHELERNRFWLNLLSSDSKFLSQTLIGYIETATNGYDPGFDGSYRGSSKTVLYTLIDGQSFSIQAKAIPFDIYDTIPIGFKTNIAGNLTIALDHFDGLFSENQDIFIEDKVLNTVHNLKESPYTFNSEIGTFNDRFVLKYTDQSQTLGLNDLSKNANPVFFSITNQNLKIKSENLSIQEINLYSISGQLIYSKKGINNLETTIIDLKDRQIYIARVLMTDGTVINKKILF